MQGKQNPTISRQTGHAPARPTLILSLSKTGRSTFAQCHTPQGRREFPAAHRSFFVTSFVTDAAVWPFSAGRTGRSSSHWGGTKTRKRIQKSDANRCKAETVAGRSGGRGVLATRAESASDCTGGSAGTQWYRGGGVRAGGCRGWEKRRRLRRLDRAAHFGFIGIMFMFNFRSVLF